MVDSFYLKIVIFSFDYAGLCCVGFSIVVVCESYSLVAARRLLVAAASRCGAQGPEHGFK